MALLVALSGVFVYLRVEADLSDSIDEGLQSRADDLERRLQTRNPGALQLGVARGEGEEDFVTQVLLPSGEVLASTTGQIEGAVLNASQVEVALKEPSYFDESDVPGIEESARLLASPVDGAGGPELVVVGVSTGDRAETLSALMTTLAIGGAIALLLASALGYILAGLGMRPVEAMRVRAGQITLRRGGERLPIPATDDEIARLGQTLNNMLGRLEDSMERERAFVADAGHELRTPLAVLRGELELALRPGRSEGERTAAMVAAIEEADRLQRLANALMESGGSEVDRIALRRENTDVVRMLEGVRMRFVRRASLANREVSVVAEDDLQWSLDPRRMESALENLLENALRHGAGRIEVRACVEAGSLVLSVSDQGSGFPPEFASRAFDRFTRAEASRTTEGTGLGLAIVRAIAEAHGGAAANADEPRGGAGVEIRIPPAT